MNKNRFRWCYNESMNTNYYTHIIMSINTVLCVLSLCVLQQFTLLCTTELLFNLLLGLKGYIILNACIYIYIYIYIYICTYVLITCTRHPHPNIRIPMQSSEPKSTDAHTYTYVHSCTCMNMHKYIVLLYYTVHTKGDYIHTYIKTLQL